MDTDCHGIAHQFEDAFGVLRVTSRATRDAIRQAMHVDDDLAGAPRVRVLDRRRRAAFRVDPGVLCLEDGGKLVNAMIVDGQVCGGTAQGIGTCLLEAMPFDAHGQPLASSLLDYFLPGATEVPPIRVLHMETPSPHTEFGVKGIGEGGAVGPPAAILCAVNDALRAVGAEVHDLPLTPVRIMQAISGGSASRSTRS